MNNLFVYCEIEDGVIADVSLELLTKGRSLANQLHCKLEALVIGHKLDDVAAQVFPYGVDTLYHRMKRYLCELFLQQDLDTLRRIMARAEALEGADSKELGRAFQALVGEMLES